MSGQNQFFIRIVPYSSEWSLGFQKEKERLFEILSPHVVTIEHTGSTSIPNQEAKPIIDMFAADHTLLARTHQLHILPFEGFNERKELLFRDYLRSHPEFVKEDPKADES